MRAAATIPIGINTPIAMMIAITHCRRVTEKLISTMCAVLEATSLILIRTDNRNQTN